MAEFRTYHVDRMAYLGLTEKPREGQDALAEHPLENYQKTSFSMYGGDVKHVTLRVSNWMMGAIIDKFGRQNYAHPVNGILLPFFSASEYTTTASNALST